MAAGALAGSILGGETGCCGCVGGSQRVAMRGPRRASPADGPVLLAEFELCHVQALEEDDAHVLSEIGARTSGSPS